MDLRIVQFIAALRASGVRISLAESEDAFRAIEQMGVAEREAFRISLRATLVKDAEDQEQFEKLFPLFFQPGQPPAMGNPAQDLTPEEARMLAKALRQMSQDLRRMLEKLLEGEPLSQQELERLDMMLNREGETDLRYQNWLARQMEKALKFSEVRKAMEELAQTLRQMGMDRGRVDRLRKALQANQDALREQLRQFAGQRIAERLSQKSRQERMDNLYNRPFHLLSEDEMQQLRREVQRLAAALRTRLALRLKRAKTGQLDVKGTLRGNLKHGNVPIELRYRSHSLKPKIVVLCDISTSMRYCSELMLGLLYSIQDQISKTHAFAFIDHLEFISPYFVGNRPAEAVEEILRHMPSGHYNTDLGSSLVQLTHDYLDTIDRHSTFIVVGDARNNFNDPHLDSFLNLVRRSRNTVWLNPEAVPLWGTGDSDMLRYGPLCQRTFQVSNLSQLNEAIDHLLLG